jgi:AraC-like DNA-binding protein
MTFGERLESALHQLVLSGDASTGAICRQFAISERTLRRRLAEEGKSLQQFINQTRYELARQLLSNTGLSVANIGAALHYIDSNAFSRAFRNWAGASPRQWRALDLRRDMEAPSIKKGDDLARYLAAAEGKMVWNAAAKCRGLHFKFMAIPPSSPDQDDRPLSSEKICWFGWRRMSVDGAEPPIVVANERLLPSRTARSSRPTATGGVLIGSNLRQAAHASKVIIDPARSC